ncbi:hypothetical protein GCM10009789_35760 [Kribbella sancticallisti]|uniref:DUF1905 domain-containing protein n=1 Tax=Kribbella sancticallisti TaxID=460087 RepID=A0ABP4PKP9_9ACTN
MKFDSIVEPFGPGAGIPVPDEIIDSFGAGKRPKVVVTINGHTWRTGIVPMHNSFWIGIGAGNREASGVVRGDPVEVDIEHDLEPREVELPGDLDAALRAAFDRLPYGRRLRIVGDIERAKSVDTRRRRIEAAVDALKAGSSPVVRRLQVGIAREGVVTCGARFGRVVQRE